MIEAFWNAYTDFCTSQDKLIQTWEETFKNKLIKDTSNGKVYRITGCVPTYDFLCTFVVHLREVNPSLKTRFITFFISPIRKVILEDFRRLEIEGRFIPLE